MTKRAARGLDHNNSTNRPIWLLVGKRMRVRRLQCGYPVGRIAEELGVSRAEYANYESGSVQMPAFVLARLAVLFDVPMLWFFQGASFGGKEHGRQRVASSPPYRVATFEERINFLANAFGKLDLEGQQHLLAIAAALSRTDK